MALSSDERIRILHGLVQDLSREADPQVTLRRFSDAMQELHMAQAVVFTRMVESVPGGFVVTRLSDETGRRLIDAADPWRIDPDMEVHTGGVLGTIAATGLPQLLTPLALADDPLLGEALGANRSALALPIYDQGEIQGWVLTLHPDPLHFDARELETLLVRVNVLSCLIGNQRLNQELERALAWIRDELEQIAQVQRSLLPQGPPAIPGLDVAGRFETFDRAGGDYYDFLPWPAASGSPERWTWIVADASGHGPAAAVIVAMLHMLLRTLPAPADGPAALLQEMNARLFACNTCNHFMTAFAACYEPATRELVYAVAGHNPPLVRAPDGSVSRLPVDPAVPLGILDRVDAPIGRATLEPGSVLLLFTDGLPDAQNDELETFSEARLIEALARADGDAEAILDSLFLAVRAHEAGRRSNDDQTAVVVRVR